MVTNIDTVNEILINKTVHKDILKWVYIGRCNFDNINCGSPGMMVTDLNIWDKDLKKNDMEEWTSCRYNS